MYVQRGEEKKNLRSAAVQSLHRSQVVRVLFWRTWTPCVAGASLLQVFVRSPSLVSFHCSASLLPWFFFFWFFLSYFDVTTKWRAFPSCTTPSHPPPLQPLLPLQLFNAACQPLQEQVAFQPVSSPQMGCVCAFHRAACCCRGKWALVERQLLFRERIKSTVVRPVERQGESMG